MNNLDLDKPISGKVTAIIGNVGNGKNILSLAIARYCSKKCIHKVALIDECVYCEKYGINQEERQLTLYANFHTALPDINNKYMESPLDFLNISQKDKGHKLAIIDEPNAWGFDSRESISPTSWNIEMARKFQQTRHYNMDIIVISQQFSMFDKRGRNLTSIDILAISPDKYNFRYALIKSDDLVIPFTIKKSFARKAIYPYYDSSEIITLVKEEDEKGEIDIV